MGSSRDRLEELNLSRDEVERIGEALKNKEFRQLLADYVEEIQDPENRKLYEKEITQLEKERGIDVTFINPLPGYVIKTSVNGVQKGFINICVNENVQKPSSSPAEEGGSRGLRWSLPHILAPPREDIDNKRERCQVFDVVFHPDTLHLSQKNKSFATMVNNTACDAVESNFDVKLDTKNLKFPKLKYKGMAHASVIRKPSGEKPVERSGEEKEFYDNLYRKADEMADSKTHIRKSKKTRQNNVDDKTNYTTPKYTIKHRSHVDLQDFTEHKGAKMNAAIPKELAIEVNLPLLKSSADISLDVTEKTVQLISEKPAKYKLNLTLPYSVLQDNGNAKFDKDTKKLLITLPVKQRSVLVISDLSDSGVESDHCLPTPESDSSVGDMYVVPELSEQTNHKTGESVVQNSPAFRTRFLDENLQYLLPDYSCHVFENVIAFTLNVKSVDANCVCKWLEETGSAFYLKFASISSSFYTVYYAFCVKLPDFSINEEDVSVETWDNNVVIQIKLGKSSDELKSYYVGIDDTDLKLKYIQELSVLNSVYEKSSLDSIIQEESVKVNINSADYSNDIKEMSLIEETDEAYKEAKDVSWSIPEEEKTKSRAIDFASLSCESSGDELSYSYSPSKGKGILKRFARKPFGRSISESSLDDFVCCSSFENCYTSVDSVIPENGEISSSLKKTVRFNDVVSRQLYREKSLK